ncbi:caspase-7-like [Lineus longissimus]|uniref:caspase-7-like n=1 Tax=Lineus longissimus TaxID=88925 RepID=UPI002B4DF268
MDNARQKHGQLSIRVGRELTSQQIRSMKQLMSGFGEGELEKMADFYDIYASLERQLKVQLGDYSYLRNLLDSIGAAKVSKEVLKMEQEIRAMMGQQAPRFVKPNPPPHEPMQVEEAKLLRSSVQISAEAQISADAKPIGMVAKHEDCPPELKYPLQFRPGGVNGLLLIIDEFTHHRKGSREDVKRMAALFETVFGFKIEYHQDKLKQEIIDIYREKTNELRSSPVQRFFSVLLSHGDDKGILTCKPPGRKFDRERDARLNIEKDIQPMFNSRVLPQMAGRPKVFFVQSCRGVSFQEGQEVADDAGDQDDDDETVVSDAIIDYPPQALVPDDADILLSYAQTLGYKAFRDKVKGSWYIQAICDVLEKYHKKYDLMTMLTIVSDKVSSLTTLQGEKVCLQMPCLHSTLRKRIYMTP